MPAISKRMLCCRLLSYSVLLLISLAPIIYLSSKPLSVPDSRVLIVNCTCVAGTFVFGSFLTIPEYGINCSSWMPMCAGAARNRPGLARLTGDNNTEVCWVYYDSGPFTACPTPGRLRRRLSTGLALWLALFISLFVTLSVTVLMFVCIEAAYSDRYTQEALAEKLQARQYLHATTCYYLRTPSSPHSHLSKLPRDVRLLLIDYVQNIGVEGTQRNP